MNTSTHRFFATLVPLVLVATACGSSDDVSTDQSDDTSAVAESTAEERAETTESLTTETPATDSSVDGDAVSWFVDGALTSDPTTVNCTLENGSESTCYQIEVASLASTVDTDGPFCPATTSDVGGIWVWDGDDPGLYALDTDFWDLMTEQGYEFADADGNISIVDPAGSPMPTATSASWIRRAALPV